MARRGVCGMMRKVGKTRKMTIFSGHARLLLDLELAETWTAGTATDADSPLRCQGVLAKVSHCGGRYVQRAAETKGLIGAAATWARDDVGSAAAEIDAAMGSLGAVARLDFSGKGQGS